MKFGPYIRQKREAKALQGTRLSLRAFARQLDIEPSYLSKIEREEFAPPSEELIVKIAKGLDEDSDMLLALAGKVASDVKEAIIASGGSLASEIRREKLQPSKPAQTTGTARSRRRKPLGVAEKDSHRVRAWKIQPRHSGAMAISLEVMQALQNEYGLPDDVTKELWVSIDGAMQVDGTSAPAGEDERSKAAAAKAVLPALRKQVASAMTALQQARQTLDQLYFHDPLFRAAADNPYWEFVRRLEEMAAGAEQFERDLIDLPNTGVEVLLNGVTDLTHLEDVRRIRLSWAVFTALTKAGHRITWTYDDLKQTRDSIAVSMVNQIAEPLMDPFEAFGGDVLYTDWQAWHSDPNGRAASVRD